MRGLGHHAGVIAIRFSIHYHTQWGQCLCVAGSLPDLGEWDVEHAAQMTYSSDGFWSLELALPEGCETAFSYKYFVRHEPYGAVQWEGGENRLFVLRERRFSRVELNDWWRMVDAPECPLATSAFTRVLLRSREAEIENPAPQRLGPTKRLYRFRVSTRRVPSGHRPCLTGSDPALGDWGRKGVVTMARLADSVWQADVVFSRTDFVLAYRYALYNETTKRIVAWESVPNRELRAGGDEKALVLRADEGFRLPTGPWRGAGGSIPVFSLRTRRGLGVGEFPDIKRLVDWAVKVGLKMIQLLPINDTVATHTWLDSYPYAAISVFALHPIYLNLEAIGAFPPEDTEELLREQREVLNGRDWVDYETVMAIKSRFFKQTFDATRDAFLADPEFRAFFNANEAWLVPYAVFSCLRDRHGTCDHAQWGEHSRVTAEQLKALTDPRADRYDDIAVHYFIQFHLHKQLLDAAEYARAHGVVLKGDIPIGVYRHSVDTWIAPELFNMDVQAGAPPDDFAADGQNWKFPTYNWHVMAENGYAWWQARLKQMATYFDAFRIDHILGFFRIWQIPGDQVQGIMGHFHPSIPFHPAELEVRGLHWDPVRYCEPYIRQHLLGARFGKETETVIRECLEETRPGCYRMKPGFRTQRQVVERLELPDDAPPDAKARNEHIRNGLLALLGEVLFLKDSESDAEAFHPRHSMQHTDSFRELDYSTRTKLNEIYVDYFYHRHEQLWREQGLIRLPALKAATDMLICGEDLGMVPDCVSGVMHELGLLSLRVQRMPAERGVEFGDPGCYPYLSVCTTSTHDMSTVRGWWEEDGDRSRRFYNAMLGHSGEAPVHCEPELCREIVARHLAAPSMWAVFPIQDLLAMDAVLRRQDPGDEQINEPGNPTHFWKYRLHTNIEDLLGAGDFNAMLKQMISESGRNTAS